MGPKAFQSDFRITGHYIVHVYFSLARSEGGMGQECGKSTIFMNQLDQPTHICGVIKQNQSEVGQI